MDKLNIDRHISQQYNSALDDLKKELADETEEHSTPMLQSNTLF